MEGSGGIAFARYNANGSLDSCFGNNGAVTSYLGCGNSLVVQSDGKILVAGSHIHKNDDHLQNDDFTLVRFNMNGSLDTTFDGDGGVRTPFEFGGGEAVSVALQSDGKIVAAGYHGNKLAVVRYHVNGSLDTTFGGSGKVTTLIGNYRSYGSAVAVQADGKIVVSGAIFGPTGGLSQDFALIRYLPNGGLDRNFNGTGSVTTDIAYDWTTGMILQSDGAILLTGWSAPTAALYYTQRVMALLRYTPSGKLDTTFGDTGKLTFPIGASSESLGITLQSDGKILITGEAATGGDLAIDTDDDVSPHDLALVRANIDGSKDWSFHHNGIVTTDFGGYDGGDDSGNSVAVQSDGKIVVAGSTGGAFALVRYLGDGPEILVEQPDGKKLFDASANVNFGSALTNGSSDRTFTMAGSVSKCE